MSDWKSDLEGRILQENEKKKDTENEHRIKTNAECEKRRLETEERENKKKVEHFVKFRCAICHKQSDGPLGDFEEDTGGFDREGSRYTNISISYGPHWDTPTGLYWCRHCNNYYCEDHFHMGRCQNCANKL